MTSDQRPEGPDAPSKKVRIPDDDNTELERYLAEYTEVIDERLEEGMAAIQHAAAKLMRHLAAEVWRASGPEAGRNMRESILGSLAQSDAIRALLSHTDERFQTLQVRIGQIEESLRQFGETVEGVGRADPEAEERQRRDLEALLDRIREQVRGEVDRLAESIRGDLTKEIAAARGDLTEELAAARGDLTEELAAARGAIHDRIGHAIADAGERTGIVLDGLRAELLNRLADPAAAVEIDEVASRIEGFVDTLGHRLDRLETTQEALGREIEGYASRATDGVAEVGRRLQGEIAAIAERFEAAEQRAGGRSDRLEETVKSFREEVQAFRDRAGQGLADVVGRIREGFQMVVDRSIDQQRRSLAEVEAGLRQDLVDIQREVVQVATRTGAVLDGIRTDLAQRLEGAGGSLRDEAVQLVAQVVGRHAGQQGRNLQAITDSLRSLLEAVRRSGQDQSQVLERVLRASAGRQEALLDETVSALRASLEELGTLYTEGKKVRSEDAGSFTRRVRGVEQRLERLTQELDAELPPTR